MVDHVIPPPPVASVAVAGTAPRFPVRGIFCVGRNYGARARAMGKDPDREPPFFFTKPADAVVDDGATVSYPQLTTNFHDEIEPVVAIGTAGVAIAVEQALDHINGDTVGIDLTRRELQFEARDKGGPWDWGKAFDQSAPCAAIVPIAGGTHPAAGRIRLAINGDVKQDADLAELIWPVPDVIARLCEAVALAPGDLVYTGTPAGVGPIVPATMLPAASKGSARSRPTSPRVAEASPVRSRRHRQSRGFACLGSI